MSDRVSNLQSWINARLPREATKLVVDGQWGPATRSAVIEVFRSVDAPAVTPGEVKMIADRLRCEPRQLRAFAATESGGAGWDKTGLLACLWERHYLWRRVQVAVPLLSNPKPGGYTIDADRDGVCDSWERIADASGLFGFSVAAECASFGKFQIMGAHWKALGYASVADFVWRLSQSEFAHYEAFARFIEANRLVSALRQVSGDPETCRAIASGYNGKAYAKAGYHEKIARHYRLIGPA